MKLLALETSGRACSVAAWEGGAADGAGLRGHRRLDAGRDHATVLLPMVQAVLAEAGWSFAELDALAVNRGPGSFTGIRVGVAAARGLALAADLPVVGLTGLEALAAAAGPVPSGATVLAVLDARRAEVYAQAFDAELAPLDEPCAVAPEAAAAGLARPLVLIGSGARPVRTCLPADDDVAVRDADLDARVVAERAAVHLGRGGGGSGFALTPLYLRPPDARPHVPIIAAPGALAPAGA